MTTRMFTSPLFLGFDHLEQMLERASKTSSDGYPPYNIEQTGPSGLRITLAVAGFTMDDLQITQEDNQLVIRGRQNDDSQGRIFLHRGIAARQFQRAFVLAEGIEVKGAWLDNGLLHIDLVRPQPEARVKTRTSGCNADNSLAQLSGGEDRVTVTYDQIPPVLVDAVLSAEDRTYFKHGGVDPVGVARALWADLRSSGSQHVGSRRVESQGVGSQRVRSHCVRSRRVRSQCC